MNTRKNSKNSRKKASSSGPTGAPAAPPPQPVSSAAAPKKRKSVMDVTIECWLTSMTGKPPISIHDAIITGLKPTRLSEYRSIRSRVIKCLKQGGSHVHLTGTTLFPSFTARGGLAPVWSNGAAPMDDLVPDPDWTKTTELVLFTDTTQAISSQIDGLTADRAAAIAKALSKQSARNYKILTEGFNILAQGASDLIIERDEHKGQRDRAEAEKAAQDKKMRTMENRLSRLEKLLEREPA